MNHEAAAELNTKYRCASCGAIEDFAERDYTPCLTCEAFSWEQITIAPVCDFCGGDNPRWRYHCRDFRYPEPPGWIGPIEMSCGDWAACDACSELIEAGSFTRLSRRATSAYVARHPESRPARKALLARNIELHRSFADNKMSGRLTNNV